MVIVVEGVDCTGKSNLCHNLKSVVGGEVYSTPPESFKNMRKKIDKFASAQESFDFYYKGLVVAVDEIKTLAKKNNFVFVDRFWVSTAATHLAMGVCVPIPLLISLDCVDFTVLLTVDEECQRLRFNKRGMTDGDKKLQPYFNAVKLNFESLIQTYCSSNLVVNTSHISENDVAKCVLDQLGYLGV